MFELDNRHELAATVYRDAIQVAQPQGAKLWEPHDATRLAWLWKSREKTTVPRDLLAPIYAWFTERIDTVDRRDAKALLEELSCKTWTRSGRIFLNCVKSVVG
jgi:hypothetical protein